jgi:hypothetical protein
MEAVVPETVSRPALSMFKVSAWTNSKLIPMAHTLVVPDPEEQGGAHLRRAQELAMLRYPVLIHIDKVDQEIGPDDGWIDIDSSNSGQSGSRTPEEATRGCG